MATGYEILFEPLTVKGYRLKNRVVVPPMLSNRNLAGPDGVEWYAEFAAGGPGLVIVEAARLHQFGEELNAETLRPLADAIHEGGATAVIQLFWAPGKPTDNPGTICGKFLATVPGAFAAAARACIAAGFDGVEPHGAHGYLLNQFFSPRCNPRSDQYGGDLEGRMRMGLHVVAAVREAIGDEPLLLYRHTPVEVDSYDLDESVVFARRLVEAGVDILDISPSSFEAPGDRAAPFQALGIAPVIAVGELGHPDRAREALAEGRCALVAIGRGHIADPNWADKVKRGALDELVECTECNQGCYGNLRAGEPITCVQR